MTPREICLQLAKDIDKSSAENPFGSIDLWPYFERAIAAADQRAINALERLVKASGILRREKETPERVWWEFVRAYDAGKLVVDEREQR